jgi:hypothetical protein
MFSTKIGRSFIPCYWVLPGMEPDGVITIILLYRRRLWDTHQMHRHCRNLDSWTIYDSITALLFPARLATACLTSAAVRLLSDSRASMWNVEYASYGATSGNGFPRTVSTMRRTGRSSDRSRVRLLLSFFR